MNPNLEIVRKTCDNGLRVILIRKPGFVKSMFMMGINAGGLHQQELQNGQKVTHPSGCAHFLEHQMFRLNGKDVTEALAKVSAEANAMTNYDNTYYYVSTASSEIEKPLNLLMEFVQTLDIDEQSVNKEKGIILSELNMYKQQPDSVLVENLSKNMYQVYPLHTDVLGSAKDIQEMSVEDLQDFYNCFYDSSQMILCGVTGQELDPIWKQIEQHQKGIQRRMKGDVVPVFDPEPKEVVKTTGSVEMDITVPFSGVAIKMEPSGDAIANRRKDMMLTLWLTGTFGSLNPNYEKCLSERIISPFLVAECDLTTRHAYLMMICQTERPEAFIATAKEVLNQRPLLQEDIFNSLKIREIASSIRSVENFEWLNVNYITDTFNGLDPMEELEILKSLTCKEVNEFVQSLDFSQVTDFTVKPYETQEEDDLEQ